MPTTINLAFELTPGGLEEAQAELDRIRSLFEGSRPSPGGTLPGEAVWRACQGGGLSQALLQLLPTGPEGALTFAELGEHMRTDDGAPGTKSSIRAVYRNVKRVENRLRKAGEIDREVIRVDYRYATEGANRYYLRPEDKAAIAAANSA